MASLRHSQLRLPNKFRMPQMQEMMKNGFDFRESIANFIGGLFLDIYGTCLSKRQKILGVISSRKR